MDSEKIQFIIELLKQGDTKDSVQALKDVADQAAKTQDALKQLSAQAQSTQTNLAKTPGGAKSGNNSASPAADAINSDNDRAAQKLKADITSGEALDKKLGAAHLSAADYDRQRQQLQAYYADAVAQAKKNSQDIDLINVQKNERLKQFDEDRKKATDQTYQNLTKIEDFAATNLASGLSTAFTSIIQGTKGAGQAFEEFAAKFLQQVAQMIIQTIILAEVQALLKAFGGGGISVAGSGATKNADGGIHFAAAHGIMLAAAGVAGVSQVDSPTVFPKFNVLAGEAGSEMLTVLAKPQAVDVNGQPAVMGNVGPHRLAIMSQESLSAMVNQPRLMADGGMAGLVDSSSGGNTGLKVSSVAPQTDGRIVVELTPHPAYEQRVVQNSIAGARVQIASDLNTDTPIRRNAQGILG